MDKKIILYSELLVGTILSFFLIFFIWKSSFSYHCLSLVLPFIMLIVVSYGYIELKMEERHCIKKCYFKNNTFFAKVLSSRLFISIFYVIVSIVMSISTFVVSLGFSTFLWWYLVVHILVSILVFKSLNYLFRNTFQERYQALFAREWSIKIMAFLLIGVFIYISLNSYTPEYLSHSLKETVNNAIKSVSSNCEYIALILKFGKLIDSSFWWILSESTEQINNMAMKAGIWLAFLFYNSLALLGINRLILQIIYILNKKFDNKKELSG